MIVTKEEQRKRMEESVGAVCARMGCKALRVKGSNYCLPHQLKSAAAAKAETKREVVTVLKKEQVRIATSTRGNCDLCGFAISAGDEYRQKGGVGAHQVCLAGAAAILGGSR